MSAKYLVLGLAVLMYGLVIGFPHRKAWFTLGAAAAVLALGIVSPAEAFGTLVNWNVLLIYVGGLVIAELFIYSRAPAALADAIVKSSPTVGLGVVFILVMTGLLSAFVENVATVLVMAPIALALCRKMGIPSASFMIGLAVMANLQGTATLVGDPPSMIFASYAGYGFNDFLFHAGRPSIFFAVQLGMLAGALYFYWRFRGLGAEKVELPAEKVLSYFPTALLVLMIGGLAAISFLFGGLSVAGPWCFFLGLAGLGWYAFARGEGARKAWTLVKGLDWETLLFLVGIFIVIGAVAEVGLLEDLASFLRGLIGQSLFIGFAVIVGISVLLSGFIDNVPYIIVMLPVAASLAKSLGLPQELYMFGLLVGSCLGGNLTPFGASANVVAVSILKKEGERLGFGDWLKVGAPFTLLTTSVAAAFIWLVWR